MSNSTALAAFGFLLFHQRAQKPPQLRFVRTLNTSIFLKTLGDFNPNTEDYTQFLTGNVTGMGIELFIRNQGVHFT